MECYYAAPFISTMFNLLVVNLVHSTVGRLIQSAHQIQTQNNLLHSKFHLKFKAIVYFEIVL